MLKLFKKKNPNYLIFAVFVVRDMRGNPDIFQDYFTDINDARLFLKARQEELKDNFVEGKLFLGKEI